MDDTPAWLHDAPPDRIAGRTVVLQRWRAADADEQLHAVLESLDALVAWMPWADNYDPGTGVDFLRRTHEAWEARTSFEYAVRDVEDRIVGAMGLHPRIGVGGIEIGYWTRSDATRRGHATRGAALATHAALALDGVDHVEIRHDRANLVSGRIPERLGYRHIATVERDAQARSETGTALHWRMTADAFPASPARRFAADEGVDLVAGGS